MSLKRFKRVQRRSRQQIMMIAYILELLGLDDAEAVNVVGRTIGSINIKRARKSVDGMWNELGCFATRVYRINLESLRKLYSLS